MTRLRLNVARRAKTLRFRFALWVIGLLAIMLIAFGAFMYASLAQGLFASIDASLQLSATQAIAAVNIENGAINFSDSIPEETTADLQARGLTIRVLDVNGQVIQAVGPYRALPVDAAVCAPRSSNSRRTPAPVVRLAKPYASIPRPSWIINTLSASRRSRNRWPRHSAHSINCWPRC